MYSSIVSYRFPTHIISGSGAIERLPSFIKRLGSKRCGIFSDPNFIKTVSFNIVLNALRDSNIVPSIYSNVQCEPSIDNLLDTSAFVRKHKLDLLIGIGGGSVLDTTKGTSWFNIVGGNPASYLGIDLVPVNGIPMILIPTTAGTGSEVTPAAIFYNPESLLKEAIFSEYHYCYAALLDPRLTLTVPPDLTASTGMDALIHAIECFLSVRATVVTDALAFGSVQSFFKYLPIAYNDGLNIEARAKMQEACMMSAISFGHAGVALIHALSYAFGGVFHVPHGVANSIMMLPVLKWTFPSVIPKFAELCRAIGADDPDAPDEQNAETFLEELEHLYFELNLPRSLQEVNVPKDAIPSMAERTMRIHRLLNNHPRKPFIEDVENIFRSAY